MKKFIGLLKNCLLSGLYSCEIEHSPQLVYELRLNQIDVSSDETNRSCWGDVYLMEHWLSNKYDFCFYGAVIRNGEVFENVGSDCGFGVADPMGIWRISRKDICRENLCNGKTHGCPSNPQSYEDYLLKYIGIDDQLMLTMSEYDPLGFNYNHFLDVPCDGATGQASFSEVITTSSDRVFYSIVPQYSAFGSDGDFNPGNDLWNAADFLNAQTIITSGRMEVTYELVPL